MKDETSPSEIETIWPRRPAHMMGWSEELAQYVRARMASDGSIYARTVVEPFRGVEFTPSSGGAVVEAGSGTLYGAESPLGGPVVNLLDDGELIAVLIPGVARDFTSRPRQFVGPLTAVALSAIGITAILLDLETT